MLIAMLIGANNYEINLGFILVFLLAGIGLSAMLQTWANLSRLELQCGSVEPVFCGESAEFTFQLRNNRKGIRAGIQLVYKTDAVALDLNNNQPKKLDYLIKTTQRGSFQPERWTVFTYFPLSMFYAWAYFKSTRPCVVYPAPVANDIPLDQLFYNSQKIAQKTEDHTDFRGHREYNRGDSPRKIDWKALARNRGMLVKEFFNPIDNEIWLEWDDVMAAEKEQKLSILCRAIIELDKQNALYGLRIPGVEIKPRSGNQHKAECLKQLAMFAP